MRSSSTITRRIPFASSMTIARDATSDLVNRHRTATWAEPRWNSAGEASLNTLADADRTLQHRQGIFLPKSAAFLRDASCRRHGSVSGITISARDRRSERDDLSRSYALVGRQNDGQAFYGVGHVVRQVEILLNRAQQKRLLAIAKSLMIGLVLGV